LRAFLDRCWYGRAPESLLLLPLAFLFAMVTALRRQLYRWGWLASVRLPVPVVVVGNLTVGGSGKTPLVLWLIDQLRAAGLHPGVVSRGYGGNLEGIAPVGPDSDPAAVGDEPVLIARRAGCPVWVGRRRAAAAHSLLAAQPEVDVVIADDGLQHYALARDLEIVVVDGQRGFGNGRLLPAGPLREPVSRLREVDALVVNGGGAGAFHQPGPVFDMRLSGRRFWNLRNPNQERDADAFRDETPQAVAGIGNPQRFFVHLEALGLRVIPHPFPDHHAFVPGDLPAGTVLMTEKDAVKCAAWAPADTWALRIDACLGEGLQSLIIDTLKARHGQQTA
jgi:tetraacyldisaccharide 4'-kinase